METKLVNQSINRFDILDKTISILKTEKIDTIGKICSKSQADLLELEINKEEINKIKNELQSLGLRLKNSI